MKMKRRYALHIIFLLFTINCSLFTAYAEDKGPLVSIELRDVELRDVMRAIGQEHGINIIVDEKLTGKVTVSLRNVPLWDAIDSILKGKGYSYIKESNIVSIVPLEDDADLITRTMTVKYANPKELEPVITKALSKKGTVASDIRSSTIVIKDTPSAIDRAAQLLKQVDIKTKQVMIEAQIVEISTNAREELGIQWGTMYRTGDVLVFGGATKTTSTDTAAIALTGGIGYSGNAFNVNLPAAVGAGSGGAIGIGLLTNKLTLDLQLSALEAEGKAKILSSPKVMVLDNQEATISSGTQIIIPTTTISGGSSQVTGTTEKEASLRLTVTPKIIDLEQVSLKILTKKEEFDFSRSVLGIPPKTSRETQTGVLIKNGETIVIGGIYTETDTEGENRVPLLSKIPLLGWLFKKETKRKDKTELLIFITPHIKTDDGS
ncbi:MAG: type IV pilus secretin PilQ [Nitrospirae bacterium]|nr:type IV pilus secretin PilQ [Nitrospirota bacterium]